MNVAKTCNRIVGAEHAVSHVFRFVFRLNVLLALSLTLLITTGCGYTLSGLLKSKENDSVSNSQPALIKPKLDNASESELPSDNTREPLNKAGSSEGKNSEPEVSNTKPAFESGKTKSNQGEQEQREEQLKPPKRLTGTDQTDFPEEKDQKRGDRPLPPLRSKTDQVDDDLLASEDEVRNPDFKKHDHSKYVTKIKNAALDFINKESDCSYARICRHNTTDEWSLGIYFVQGKNYYFRSYVWDPIENAWTETFESEKKPHTGMRKHLSFSSAGKRCLTLKGSDRE